MFLNIVEYLFQIDNFLVFSLVRTHHTIVYGLIIDSFDLFSQFETKMTGFSIF